MLLNSHQLEELLLTNGKGAKAQVGYDLTLKGVKSVHGGMVTKDKTTVYDYIEVLPLLGEEGKFIYHLQPGVYSLTFEQGIKLPANRTAFIRHRSSILRCGGIITSGIFDPGFEVDEMGGMLFAQQELFIELGARIAQVYMFENHEAEAYNGQWQKNKDVK